MNPAELDVAYIARLARIHLTPEETAQFQSQLSTILTYVEQISRLDMAGVEPTAHTAAVFDVVREDTARDGLDPADALRNAPRSANGLFMVPKVVE
jgi:aspartyl-tRNA(Asn)/glutamyl-tRNA(Gln) amidotransferase subunit C